MERTAPIDSVQAETILAMLLSLQAGVLEEVNLEITKLIETEDDFNIGIVCLFNATIPDDPDKRSKFSLWIGKWDKTHQVNPQTIAIAKEQAKAKGYAIMPIGNLGLVVDKLREYKVW